MKYLKLTLLLIVFCSNAMDQSHRKNSEFFRPKTDVYGYTHIIVKTMMHSGGILTDPQKTVLGLEKENTYLKEQLKDLRIKLQLAEQINQLRQEEEADKKKNTIVIINQPSQRRIRSYYRQKYVEPHCANKADDKSDTSDESK